MKKSDVTLIVTETDPKWYLVDEDEMFFIRIKRTWGNETVAVVYSFGHVCSIITKVFPGANVILQSDKNKINREV